VEYIFQKLFKKHFTGHEHSKKNQNFFIFRKAIITMRIKNLSSFMQEFSLFVNEEEVMQSLHGVRQTIDGMPYRKGLFFKLLLQGMGRQIDWRFAEEMENAFIEVAGSRRVTVQV